MFGRSKKRASIVADQRTLMEAKIASALAAADVDVDLADTRYQRGVASATIGDVAMMSASSSTESPRSICLDATDTVSAVSSRGDGTSASGGSDVPTALRVAVEAVRITQSGGQSGCSDRGGVAGSKRRVNWLLCRADWAVACKLELVASGVGGLPELQRTLRADDCARSVLFGLFVLRFGGSGTFARSKIGFVLWTGPDAQPLARAKALTLAPAARGLFGSSHLDFRTAEAADLDIATVIELITKLTAVDDGNGLTDLYTVQGYLDALELEAMDEAVGTVDGAEARPDMDISRWLAEVGADEVHSVTCEECFATRTVVSAACPPTTFDRSILSVARIPPGYSYRQC